MSGGGSDSFWLHRSIGEVVQSVSIPLMEAQPSRRGRQIIQGQHRPPVLALGVYGAPPPAHNGDRIPSG
jgi:hypothetical protein